MIFKYVTLCFNGAEKSNDQIISEPFFFCYLTNYFVIPEMLNFPVRLADLIIILGLFLFFLL